MGQAKRRGTFEDRKEAAILREEEAELEAQRRRLDHQDKPSSRSLSKLAAFTLAASLLNQR